MRVGSTPSCPQRRPQGPRAPTFILNMNHSEEDLSTGAGLGSASCVAPSSVVLAWVSSPCPAGCSGAGHGSLAGVATSCSTCGHRASAGQCGAVAWAAWLTAQPAASPGGRRRAPWQRDRVCGARACLLTIQSHHAHKISGALWWVRPLGGSPRCKGAAKETGRGPDAAEAHARTGCNCARQCQRGWGARLRTPLEDEGPRRSWGITGDHGC